MDKKEKSMKTKSKILARSSKTSNEHRQGATPYHEVASTENLLVGQKPSSESNLCPPALKERGYSIAELIGGGAFSKVYKAKYKNMGDKDIAVKIISLDQVPEVWKEKCLRQELKIVKKLQHPYVVKVWDIIKTRKSVFIFMDLAENNSVFHFLLEKKKPIPELTAKIWFSQTAGAVCYMHQKGIGHRDLKNENILLDRDYNAKLTDFGFACFTYDKDSKDPVMSPTVCGTTAYIAPEVMNPPYDAKLADVWSLGVCLFEMVSACRPFNENQNHRKLLKHQLNRKWRLPTAIETIISEEAKDLIVKMMEPDVSVRPTSLDVIKHNWIVNVHGALGSGHKHE